MLRSLAEVIRMGGYSGLFVTIDDLEILVSRSSLEPVHYTKMKREDTYESIRQLIDDIDSMKNIMFVYAFDRELIDNENAGLKSGYVLTSFDGHSITSTSELKSLLQYYSAGETVDVEVQVPDNGSYEAKTFSLTDRKSVV